MCPCYNQGYFIVLLEYVKPKKFDTFQANSPTPHSFFHKNNDENLKGTFGNS